MGCSFWVLKYVSCLLCSQTLPPKKKHYNIKKLRSFFSKNSAYLEHGDSVKAKTVRIKVVQFQYHIKACEFMYVLTLAHFSEYAVSYSFCAVMSILLRHDGWIN